MLLQVKHFVISVGARGVEEQDSERVARPAVVAEKTFETRLLGARLFVDGSDADGRLRRITQPRVIGLGTPRDGIDKRRGGGTKIEGRERAAIGGLQKRLIFGGDQKQRVCAVGGVVKQFNPRGQAAGRLTSPARFRAGQTTPKAGTGE